MFRTKRDVDIVLDERLGHGIFLFNIATRTGG